MIPAIESMRKQVLDAFENLSWCFWHPPKWAQAILWTLAISFFILLIVHTAMGEPVKLTFNFQLQLIEVEIGNKVAQIPANITIENGHMLINGVPLRGWLESQGYTVIWDNEAQAAIATPGK